MRNKNLSGLRVCKYCGGLPEVKKELRHFRNSTFKLDGAKFYVRCSQCHARTSANKRIENVKNAWIAGSVFRPIYEEKNFSRLLADGEYPSYNYFEI